MRSCDGTSGLVRGNRRKAVLRLRGCFQRVFVAFSLWGSGFLSPFSDVRENRKPPSATRFIPTKPQGANARLRSGRQISVFPALPESFVSGMRQALEPLSATVFRVQKPQVNAPCHSGVIDLLFLLILFLPNLAAIVVLP